MIQEINYDDFMARLAVIINDGDRRTKIRYSENDEEFTLYIVDIDGIINKTNYSKDAIITFATATYPVGTTIDSEKEISLWKYDVLRDAIKGVFE